MVSMLESGLSGLGLSAGWGYFVVFLGKHFYLLSVPLSTQEYKWTQANCWVT